MYRDRDVDRTRCCRLGVSPTDLSGQHRQQSTRGFQKGDAIVHDGRVRRGCSVRYTTNSGGHRLEEGDPGDWGGLESEQSFRLLVDSITDYAIFMLDPDGYVATWNAGAERIKGYTAREIIGQHFSKFYLPEAVARQQPQTELRGDPRPYAAARARRIARAKRGPIPAPGRSGRMRRRGSASRHWH
jgi:PAS domain S-box-containing protein